MQIPLANLTTDQIKAADGITAFDPNRPSFREQIWRPITSPNARLPSSGPHGMQTIEVLIDSSQDNDLQGLLRQVEAAKGYLPPDIMALKK
jgi:hypothetical protein